MPIRKSGNNFRTVADVAFHKNESTHSVRLRTVIRFPGFLLAAETKTDMESPTKNAVIWSHATDLIF